MAPQNGAPDRGPRGGGRGLGAWVKRNKGLAIALGGLGVVAVVTMVKKGNASNTGGTDTTAAGSNTGIATPGVYGYGSGDLSTSDQYAGEMAQLQDFLNAYTAGQLGSLPGGQPAPAPSPAPPPVRVPVDPKKRPAPVPVSRRYVAPQWIRVPKNATLLSLSEKYLGTSNRSAIAHANNLGTGAGLRADQRLLIPGHYA